MYCYWSVTELCKRVSLKVDCGLVKDNESILLLIKTNTIREDLKRYDVQVLGDINMTLERGSITAYNGKVQELLQNNMDDVWKVCKSQLHNVSMSCAVVIPQRNPAFGGSEYYIQKGGYLYSSSKINSELPEHILCGMMLIMSWKNCLLDIS